jgi:nucleoside-diphosphate-sugar epimerase
MNILVTGNNGYIGPVLFKELKKKIKNVKIFGLDTNYFKIKNYSDLQYSEDVRNFSKKIFKNKFEAIIHLASLSNDPIGNRYEKQTKQINIEATKRLIDMAKKNGCKTFVFASSCSVYGKNGNNHRDEQCKTKPLTAYAKSKIIIEKYLKKKSDKNFKSICLRFATACGASPNIRFDLVLNDFVFSAITKKKIKLNSSGNAWRPLIDVKDMAKAMVYSVLNNKKVKKILIVNVGSNISNYKILDLAKKVKSVFKNTSIEIQEKIHDNRSYRVDFSNYDKFKNNEYKHLSIEESILNLKKNIEKLYKINKRIKFDKFVRLKVLEKKVKEKKLTKNLKWK